MLCCDAQHTARRQLQSIPYADNTILQANSRKQHYNSHMGRERRSFTVHIEKETHTETLFDRTLIVERDTSIQSAESHNPNMSYNT